jgi:Glycosyl hydrolase family 71
MPSSTTVFNAAKKVFAHYVASFPLSIDNQAAAGDYYNRQYLTKNGESNKWAAEGGYIRSRPLGVNPSAASKFQQLNLETEIRSAIARGISGFTFDIMSTSQVTSSNSPLNLMLAAATAVDSRFKIIAMPDLTVLGTNSAAIIEIVEAIAKSPAAYRLSDGRLVISAFDASLDSAGWWASVLTQLTAKGIKTAFVPTFLNWTLSADLFAPFSYGFGDWGGATAAVSNEMEGDSAIVHKEFDKVFMMPADPQQFRPKDFEFWEAGNSAAFRAAWASSINGDADWVQMVTWNDFSESSQIEPATDTTLNRTIGTGFYNLTGYYASWFVTGHQPAITHDVLYWFYRREPTSAKQTAQAKSDHIYTGTADNQIELVAFLTAPGTLKVTFGGHTYTENAPAGMTSFKVPTGAGTPNFTLSRSGSEVFSFNGGVEIYGPSGLPSGTQDLTYWSGSASKTGICSL